MVAQRPCILALPSRPRKPQPPDRVVDPNAFGKRVWTKCLQIAFLLVVKQRAMQSQRAGLGIVAKAGRIVGAHLEQDTHFEFAQRLATQKPSGVIIIVHTGDDMDPLAGSVGYDLL